MKFIRNIIAEKTNVIEASANCEPVEPEVDSTATDTTGMDASIADAGGPGDDSGLRQAFSFSGPKDVTEEEAESDEIDFDLLADADPDAEPVKNISDEQTDTPAPTELFDDLWPTDKLTGLSQEDPSVSSDAAPFATSDETNTEAVMRTMYHPGATPDLAPDLAPTLTPTPPQVTTIRPKQPKARPARTQMPATSAFQKIMQRENALPSGEEATLVPDQELRGPQAKPPQAKPPQPDMVASAEITGNTGNTGATQATQTSQPRKKAGRVKTRLLGFGNDFSPEADVFATGKSPAAPQTKFPVGWMVVVSGPGRGTAFTLFDGVSQIGRGEDQAIRLDFGDTSISRCNHAAIAYDPEQQKFYLGHGGKANLVRLNGTPVLSTEQLVDGAEIRLGETTLRFIGLCGASFDWGKSQEREDGDASFS